MSEKIAGVTTRWIEITTDWFQQTSQSKACFYIEKQETLWLFHVRVDQKPVLHPMKMSPQTYHEGLWEYDVAEWFIANPTTGKYIELNLAPTGAWWMMIFDAPRQRGKEDMPDLSGIKTSNMFTALTWKASLAIPILVVEKALGRDTLKHNVCFILGKNPREYLSWTRLAAKQPDFHRPDDFSMILRS